MREHYIAPRDRDDTRRHLCRRVMKSSTTDAQSRRIAARDLGQLQDEFVTSTVMEQRAGNHANLRPLLEIAHRQPTVARYFIRMLKDHADNLMDFSYLFGSLWDKDTQFSIKAFPAKWFVELITRKTWMFQTSALTVNLMLKERHANPEEPSRSARTPLAKEGRSQIRINSTTAHFDEQDHWKYRTAIIESFQAFGLGTYLDISTQ